LRELYSYGTLLVMRGSQRQTRASSTALEPSSRGSSRSSIGAPSPARVTLPSNLSESLKYLGDAQLHRLLEAVTVEINRRNQDGPKNETAAAAPTRASSQGHPATIRNNKNRGTEKIPEGTANLIRASFRAGVKAADIARTFRISRSVVNRVLNSPDKPK
jgi:hypothetical protein